MEFRRVTTSLLRPQSSPLTALFSTNAPARWTSTTQLSCRKASNGPQQLYTKRSFRTSPPQYAAKYPPSTTHPPSGSSPPDNKPLDLSAASEELGWFNRPSRASSSPRTTRSQTQEQMFNGGSSADSILAAFAANRGNRNEAARWDSLLDPSQPLSNSTSSENQTSRLMRDISAISTMPPPKTRAPIALKPLSGRMVEINSNVDVGRGFRLLEQSCARNRVRADATKQRFHERGGLKRKRLRRERWRKRFMEGFRATVGRVKELRNQGW